MNLFRSEEHVARWLDANGYEPGATLSMEGMGALAAGVTGVIQPGGSKRDAEVIEAVERAGATMIFTHRRHFRH